MVNKIVVEDIKKVLHDTEHLIDKRIEKILLFGSFARGEETVYSDIDIALVCKGSDRLERGSAYEFKDVVEEEIQKMHREVGWFSTNEHNLDTSKGVFNTNTRIKKEGILLWMRTVT